MLFVYLIFETAKLSRDKIRHQFAIDSAAFVEMTNYSDFLNRSAYVNGAFPMRIFREGFHGTELNNTGRAACNSAVDHYSNGSSINLDDVLYGEGAFPRDDSDPNGSTEQSGKSQPWKIVFNNQSERAGLNTSDSSAIDSAIDSKSAHNDSNGKSCDKTPCLTLISEKTANCWNINFEDSTQIMNMYVQIYQLLGSVESAQYSVLERLAAGHQFLTKSYYLNLGTQEALNEATGVRFPPTDFTSGIHMHCVKGILFYGNQLTGNQLQPYDIFNNYPGTAMTSSISGCNGLFQLVSVDPGVIASTNEGSPYPGWQASIAWTPPSNSFGVDVNQFKPTVHATASLWPGAQGEASVWPNPTPHYQTRLYP
jgi:hypothetical protein